MLLPVPKRVVVANQLGLVVVFQADNALQCFLEVIAQIAEKRTEIILRRKLPRLFMAYPNYKLALGFGLHHGWAIEGSLGSNHKVSGVGCWNRLTCGSCRERLCHYLFACAQVDASYLSPHVTLSDTLEAATKQYGIPILMSGQFVSTRTIMFELHVDVRAAGGVKVALNNLIRLCDQVKLLSKEWWEKCRMVDRVQLAGSGDSRRRIYDLWTCDHHNQAVRCLLCCLPACPLRVQCDGHLLI